MRYPLAAPAHHLADRGVGPARFVQEPHAGGAQAVLPELDPGLFGDELMKPPRHRMPAVVSDREPVVGEEERLLALPVVRGASKPEVLTERVHRGPLDRDLAD